jgi:hypothetical protein
MALLCFYYNTMANGHYHLDNNGQVVYHFHPNADSNESDSPYAQHNHSDVEYTVFDMLANTHIVLAIAFIFALFSIIVAIKKVWYRYTWNISFGFYLNLSLRGPPAIA